jgi:ATP-dependent protease ClpP protease subunit
VAQDTVYIRYFTQVDANSVNRLMATVQTKLNEGAKRFVVLISSPGGSVFYGLSAYNFLRGVPAEVHTHNFGQVDSMGLVLYCAGEKRYAVPHGRFLLHGVQANFPQNASLEEKQLEERLKGLKLDMENIAGVIAAAAGKRREMVFADMVERTTLNSDQAKAYGLVHEIREPLFPAGAELIAIDGTQRATPSE